MVANNLDNVGVINVQQDGALEVYDLNNFGIMFNRAVHQISIT